MDAQAKTWTYENHWVSLLDQDQAWQDARGIRHNLDDMDTSYCRRVAAFILRQANEIVDLISQDILAAGEPQGYQGQWTHERAENNFLSEVEDPVAWLRQRPLLVALNNRAEGRSARPAACDCGYPSEDDEETWDHGACYPGIIVD